MMKTINNLFSGGRSLHSRGRDLKNYSGGKPSNLWVASIALHVFMLVVFHLLCFFSKSCLLDFQTYILNDMHFGFYRAFLVPL